MYPLDPFRPKASVLHALDARVKFVLAAAFILATALTPMGAWPVYVLLLATVLAAAILSELGPAYVLRRSVLALPFVLAALPLLITVAGTPLATVRLGSWTVTFSESGTERFVSTVAKSWISVQTAILLAATTPVQGLLLAMRAVRVPRLLVAVIGLMWRYLFVLADEAGRLLRARAARSGASSQRGARAGGSIAWRARATGGMTGSLFLRSLERADRLYAAMVSRGYDGETRALPAPRVSSGSWWVLGCGLSALTLLVVAGYLFWG